MKITDPIFRRMSKRFAEIDRAEKDRADGGLSIEEIIEGMMEPRRDRIEAKRTALCPLARRMGVK